MLRNKERRGKLKDFPLLFVSIFNEMEASHHLAINVHIFLIPNWP
ncbi:hypothetical protein X953_11105 [Virgibacillus sp. SK37]|nr:hypothetical protein X953_11105 [Virgibacillus sp. SK37]